MRSGYERVILLAGAAALSLGLVLLRVSDPLTSGLFPPCPIHFLTGWYCPGCGSLRSLHQLLNGHLYAAFALNPLMVVALPFFIYGLASQVSMKIRGHYLRNFFIPGSWIWTLGAVIIAFGIARNVPVFPFNLLAPGAMIVL